MNALDTNVLVRLIVRDDPIQLARAVALLRVGPCWVPSTVLLETEWVLRAAYGYRRAQVVEVFERLLAMAELQHEAPTTASAALGWHREGLDFSDALHLAAARGHPRFASFDRALARASERLETTPQVFEPS